MLPSTLYTMSPMHLRCLKLLHQTVEEMHLQENTVYDLGLRVNVTQIMPSDLCTCVSLKLLRKMFRRICICKKMH